MDNKLGKAKIVYDNLNENTKINQNLIKEIIENIIENKKAILEANQKDISENNGFEIDFNIIKKILNDIKNIKSLYKTKSFNESKKQLLEYDNIGVLETFFDGNTYVLIEFMLKSIISYNPMILISQTDFMKYTNTVIYNIFTKTLISKKIDENIIQLVFDFDLQKYCNNNCIVRKAFVVGNTDLHSTLKRVSKINTHYIEYSDCDIYIENLENIEVLKEYIEKNNNILFKIYINESLKMDIDEAIYVSDLKEALEKISWDSCNYCSILFSDKKRSKIDFTELCKSKFLYVNKFMDFKEMVNIDMNEFYCKKNVII